MKHGFLYSFQDACYRSRKRRRDFVSSSGAWGRSVSQPARGCSSCVSALSLSGADVRGVWMSWASRSSRGSAEGRCLSSVSRSPGVSVVSFRSVYGNLVFCCSAHSVSAGEVCEACLVRPPKSGARESANQRCLVFKHCGPRSRQ